MEALIWILLGCVIVEAIWIYRLHTQVATLSSGSSDDCCDELTEALTALTDWAKEFDDKVVEQLTKCCNIQTDPTWPPSDPPEFPENGGA